MANEKNDFYYVAKILENANAIVEQMQGKTMDDFNNDSLLEPAMMFYLVQISENAKEISEELQEKHSEIPWYAIYGLRNRIVHDYGHVDLKVVYDTLTKDIPTIIKQLEKI